jgi:multidrug efflux system membrane fusion protein
MANDVTQQKLAHPVTVPANGTASPAHRSPAPLSPSPPPTPAPPRHRPGRNGLGLLVWLLIALLVLGAVGWYAYHYFYAPKAQGAAGTQTAAGPGGHHRGGGANEKIRVVPATATRGDIGVYLKGLGNVTPYNTVTVQARVSGQLMQVNFSDGQTVKQNDKLVQIDDRPYQAQLKQFQAQKEHDQALLDNANVDLKRYQTLYAQNSIQQQTLDTQVALVKQDQGTVDSDEAQIEQTQLNIIYCDITSPIDGVVGLRLVDIGNQVTANSSNLLVINQVQPIYVDFTLAEKDVQEVLAKLNEGQKLSVEALNADKTKKVADGELETTDNQIAPTTGTLKLRAVFQNQDKALFPNQFVNAKLLVETHTNVIVIPVAAIQYGTQGTYVYIINDKDPRNATVSMKPVKMGAIDDDGARAEITSGVNEGDQVVIDGVDKLSDGAKIIVSPNGGASDTGGAPATSVPAN